MDSHGYPIDPYEFLWIPVGSMGTPWISMDSYGFIWVPMGTPWIPMDSYGFLWVPKVILT